MPDLNAIRQADKWAANVFRVRSILRRYWWLLVLSTAIGLGTGAVFVSRQEVEFRSTAKLMVSGRIHVSEGNAYSEEGSNFFGTQIELMKSAQVVDQAESRVKAAGGITPTALTQFDVSLIPGASIFVLRATAKTGEYSQAFLSGVIEEYSSLKRMIRADKSEATIIALTEELARAEKEWDAAEEAVAKFQKAHSLVFLREGENTAAKYLASLNDRLASLRTQLRLFEQVDVDQLRGLPSANGIAKTANGEAGAVTPEFIAQNGYLQARQDVILLEQRRVQLLENLREGHPELVALDEKLASAKRLLNVQREQSREEFEVQRKSIASQITALEAEVEIWRSKAVEIGSRLGESARLLAKVERAKSLYERLLANVGNVGLTKNLEQDVVSVLERPSVSVPVRPGFERVLASGALAGFLLGGMILYVVDRSASQFASPEEFIASFGERILGLVPNESKAADKLQMSDGRHAYAEAFYNIRSSLFFLPYDGPMPKTLLITSAIPNEGKSTISVNVALAFAFAGSRTLLIDGDLRRGQVHRSFDRPNKVGFAEVLQRKAKWRDTIVPTETANLSIMPRGGAIAQPSKYLVHRSTDELLQEIYHEFDQIIIDSCPILAADDTTSLAPKVEAVIMVARLGTVNQRHLSLSLNALSSRQANILGVVLNGIDPKTTSYNYYTYSSYYAAAQPASASSGLPEAVAK